MSVSHEVEHTLQAVIDLLVDSGRDYASANVTDGEGFLDGYAQAIHDAEQFAVMEVAGECEVIGEYHYPEAHNSGSWVCGECNADLGSLRYVEVDQR